MSKIGSWLAIVGAILLFLACIAVIIVVRKGRSQAMIFPTSRKWETDTQIQQKVKDNSSSGINSGVFLPESL